MALNPIARLDLCYDRQAWGWLQYAGTAIQWSLPDLLGASALAGLQDAASGGLCLTPVGRWVMQSAVPVWVDADKTQWTTTGGAFKDATDPSAANGKKFLAQTDAAATTGAVSALARAADEGLYAEIYKGIVPAGGMATGNLYLHLSAGRADGTFGLRLAVEPGAPIRLQGSLYDSDTATDWIDLAVASALGDSETFLDSVGRLLTVDVLPMTDAAWNETSQTDPPPGIISVSLNGGAALLTCAADTLAAGALRLRTEGGQWHCKLAKKRFQTNAVLNLPPQARERPFLSSPAVRVGGYGPSGTHGLADVTVIGPAQASATLTISAAADDTGYAPRTVFLSTVEALFPAVWAPPRFVPDWTRYAPTFSQFDENFDPGRWTVRSEARCEFSNEDGSLSPGVGVALATRAAILWMGYRDDYGNEALYPQISGWTGFGGEGLQWLWRDRLNRFAVRIMDKLYRGDGKQVVCGKGLPKDGLVHYTAVRELLYKLGIIDDFLNFPLVQRGDVTGYYTLPQGTTREPLLDFPADMPVGMALEVIRSMSGVIDPGSGLVLPMVLGVDAAGGVQYSGMPPGVVSALLDPGGYSGLAPSQVFSAGAAGINQILNSGLVTFADLDTVRTPVVVEGYDPRTGDIPFAVAYNELLGGGPYSDPDAAGYVGIDVPFYFISRLINSPEVAAIVAQLLGIQTAFPSVGTAVKLHLQPEMFALSTFGIQDFHTTGSLGAVPFYATNVSKVVDESSPPRRDGWTQVGGHLLGQTGN